MGELLDKYNDYMRLENCTAEYVLENGICIQFSYKEENFPHLIGLHKLKDIQLVQFWLDKSNKSIKLKDVIKKIKNGSFTDTMLKGSHFYPMIEDRFKSFSYDNLTTLNYTDAIIDFDKTLINAKIKSDYVLFEERPSKEYNHMGIAYDSKGNYRYVETFFHEPSTKYIAGQTIVKVKKFVLYDANGNIIVEDVF